MRPLKPPEVRRDALSGRLVVVAPRRHARPGAPRPLLAAAPGDEPEACPFCEGREAETPPETLAVAPPGRAADAPGWQVRVVPNKFPAFERHEVVVHTPRHVDSLADLGAGELAAVASAWKARADVARADGFPYLLALVNEGRAAGASRAHTHSQLAWLREEPPLSAVEREGPRCKLCDLVAEELKEGSRVVLDARPLLVFCPPAGRAPYEMIVTPHGEHAPDAFADADMLARALLLVAEGLRRLHAVEGRVPFNAWLHTAPFGEDGHWHVEVVPRLTVLAGLELGAGIYVNTLPPETAAQALREG